MELLLLYVVFTLLYYVLLLLLIVGCEGECSVECVVWTGVKNVESYGVE